VAQVPPQLRAAFLDAVDAGRVRSMQNKSMPAAPLHRAGALLLGDAFNMRHPLTGKWPRRAERPRCCWRVIALLLAEFAPAVRPLSPWHSFDTLASSVFRLCFESPVDSVHEPRRAARLGWQSVRLHSLPRAAPGVTPEGRAGAQAAA